MITTKEKIGCITFIHLIFFALITWRMFINLERADLEFKDPIYMVGVFLCGIGGVVLIGSAPLIYREG